MSNPLSTHKPPLHLHRNSDARPPGGGCLGNMCLHHKASLRAATITLRPPPSPPVAGAAIGTSKAGNATLVAVDTKTVTRTVLCWA